MSPLDRSILRAIYDAVSRGDIDTWGRGLALTADVVQPALRRLRRNGYIEAIATGGGDQPILIPQAITEAGVQALAH